MRVEFASDAYFDTLVADMYVIRGIPKEWFVDVDFIPSIREAQEPNEGRAVEVFVGLILSDSKTVAREK